MIIKGPVVAPCVGKVHGTGLQMFLLTIKQVTSVNMEVPTNVCSGLISFEAECT